MSPSSKNSIQFLHLTTRILECMWLKKIGETRRRCRCDPALSPLNRTALETGLMVGSKIQVFETVKKWPQSLQQPLEYKLPSSGSIANESATALARCSIFDEIFCVRPIQVGDAASLTVRRRARACRSIEFAVRVAVRRRRRDVACRRRNLCSELSGSFVQ